MILGGFVPGILGMYVTAVVAQWKFSSDFRDFASDNYVTIQRYDSDQELNREWLRSISDDVKEIRRALRHQWDSQKGNG